MDIYDIAKASGYSTATVSRVINKQNNVSKKAKDRIEKVIKENGYTPNRIARSLAKKSSQLIGIMVPDIRKFFESQSAYELEKILEASGFSTILCVTTDDIRKKKSYLDLLIENQVEAIIGVGSTYEQDEFYKSLVEVSKDVPMAMLNVSPTINSDRIVNVYIDEINAMDQAVSLFKKKGYKKPLYVSLDRGFQTRSYIAKKAGFIEALYKYYDESNFVEYKLKSVEACDINPLIDFIEENDFDSIQFELDSLAVVFYKHYVNAGNKVPEDLAIIGFDNIDATEYTNQRISTIDQRIRRQVELALDNLFKLMKGEESENDLMIKAELVEKETI